MPEVSVMGILPYHQPIRLSLVGGFPCWRCIKSTLFLAWFPRGEGVYISMSELDPKFTFLLPERTILCSVEQLDFNLQTTDRKKEKTKTKPDFYTQSPTSSTFLGTMLFTGPQTEKSWHQHFRLQPFFTSASTAASKLSILHTHLTNGS